MDKKINSISILAVLLLFIFFALNSAISVVPKSKSGEEPNILLSYSSNTSMSIGDVKLPEQGVHNFFSEFSSHASWILFAAFVIFIERKYTCSALGRNVYLITSFSQAP